MIIELHAIQSFAPNLLNRDDTGMPKDCVFGGHRRARVSSQSWKRAIRHLMQEEQGLGQAFGKRSKRLAHDIAQRLEGRGWSADDAEPAAEAALVASGFRITKEARSEYLLFFGPAELERLTALCEQHRDALLADNPPAAEFKSALGHPGRRRHCPVREDARRRTSPQRRGGLPGGARDQHPPRLARLRLLHRG